MPVGYTGITITKRFTYRGDSMEEWSNKYWLTGPPPTTDAAWLALFNDIVGHEKHCYLGTTQIVHAYGYDNNDPGAHNVWDYAVPENAPIFGDLTQLADEAPMAGDQAALVQWRTGDKNSRGKWVYLRKYFHGGTIQTDDRDRVGTSVLAGLSPFADILLNGGLLGGRRLMNGRTTVTPLTAEPSEWVTTRTLKRRGKRPS